MYAILVQVVILTTDVEFKKNQIVPKLYVERTPTVALDQTLLNASVHQDLLETRTFNVSVGPFSINPRLLILKYLIQCYYNMNFMYSRY